MTNRDQLNRLKEPYRSQALENVANNGDTEKERENWFNSESWGLVDTIMQGFYLRDSPQGLDYWTKIKNNPENYTEQ